MKDTVSGPPHSNDRFCMWKHLLNHIWVTEALNRPQIGCCMVCFLNHIFSILYKHRPTCGAVYSLVYRWFYYLIHVLLYANWACYHLIYFLICFLSIQIFLPPHAPIYSPQLLNPLYLIQTLDGVQHFLFNFIFCII